MNIKSNYIKFLLFFLISISFFFNNDSLSKPSKSKQTQSKNISKKSTSKKNTSKKRTTKKKSSSKKSSKKSSTPSLTVIKDSLLEEGINYRNIYLKAGKSIHSVHIIEVDIFENNAVDVLKANNYIHDLKQLSEIIDDNNEDSNYYAGINGSFWRAYSNKPIGSTIIDGEVVELNQYKSWSSVFFDSVGKPYFDNFDLDCTIELKKQRIEVDRFNQRRDSNSIVIYNRFAGNQIPFISQSQIDKAVNSYLELYNDSQIFNDSSETQFDLETYIAENLEIEKTNSIEFPLKKICCEYLEKPVINKDIKCAVKLIDTGVVLLPENGFIISVGKEHFLNSLIISLKDTLVLKIKSSKLQEKNFCNGLSATPRLVRNGKAVNEARKEGSRGRRFINRALPRSAIGANKANNKIYLVSVEGNNRAKKIVGASLSQLSKIMTKIGCYNAMNLDGGGSTTMVVNGLNIINGYNPYKSRRISVGLAVKKLK